MRIPDWTPEAHPQPAALVDGIMARRGGKLINLDKAKFAEVFNAFGVATKARRATQLQEAFKVQGVPSLGVAGRFYTDGSLASNMESALTVTEYLIGQVRKGR